MHESDVREVAFEGEGAVRRGRSSARPGSGNWPEGTGNEGRTALLPDQEQVRSRSGRILGDLFDGVGEIEGFEVRDAANKPIGKPFRDPDWLDRGPFRGGLLGAISPDGKNLLMAITGYGTASVWEVDSRERHKLPTSTQITRIAFLNDHFAVTAHIDGAVAIWDVASRALAGEPLDHGGPVTALAIGADGKIILTGGYKEVPRLGRAHAPPGRTLVAPR